MKSKVQNKFEEIPFAFQVERGNLTHWAISTALGLAALTMICWLALPRSINIPAQTLNRLGLVMLDSASTGNSGGPNSDGKESLSGENPPSPPEELSSHKPAISHLPNLKSLPVADSAGNVSPSLPENELLDSEFPLVVDKPPVRKILPNKLEAESIRGGNEPARDRLESLPGDPPDLSDDLTQDHQSVLPPVVEKEQLDRGFQLLSRILPGYPRQAMILGKFGNVRMELEIDPAGIVRRVIILKETPGWGFGEAVRLAYREARFTPPTVGGDPVRVLWRKTIIFTP